MRRATTLLLLTSLLGLFGGCMTQEKITPAFPLERLEDQINKVTPLTFYIPIDKVQIEDQFAPIGRIGNVGGAFRRLAEMIADVNIERGQMGIMDLDPIDYELKELEEVDFEFVKEVLLQNVHIVMPEDIDREAGLEGLNERKANFNFIKSLEVYIKLKDGSDLKAPMIVSIPEKANLAMKVDNKANKGLSQIGPKELPGSPNLPERYHGTYLALSYYKGLNELSCGGKCFDMTVHQGTWRELLRKNRQVTLYVRLALDHAPKFSFSFVGHLLVKVVIDLNGI